MINVILVIGSITFITGLILGQEEIIKNTAAYTIKFIGLGLIIFGTIVKSIQGEGMFTWFKKTDDK